MDERRIDEQDKSKPVVNAAPKENENLDEAVSSDKSKIISAEVENQDLKEGNNKEGGKSNFNDQESEEKVKQSDLEDIDKSGKNGDNGLLQGNQKANEQKDIENEKVNKEPALSQDHQNRPISQASEIKNENNIKNDDREEESKVAEASNDSSKKQDKILKSDESKQVAEKNEVIAVEEDVKGKDLKPEESLVNNQLEKKQVEEVKQAEGDELSRNNEVKKEVVPNVNQPDIVKQGNEQDPNILKKEEIAVPKEEVKANEKVKDDSQEVLRKDNKNESIADQKEAIRKNEEAGISFKSKQEEEKKKAEQIVMPQGSNPVSQELDQSISNNQNKRDENKGKEKPQVEDENKKVKDVVLGSKEEHQIEPQGPKDQKGLIEEEKPGENVLNFDGIPVNEHPPEGQEFDEAYIKSLNKPVEEVKGENEEKEKRIQDDKARKKREEDDAINNKTNYRDPPVFEKPEEPAKPVKPTESSSVCCQLLSFFFWLGSLLLLALLVFVYYKQGEQLKKFDSGENLILKEFELEKISHDESLRKNINNKVISNDSNSNLISDIEKIVIENKNLKSKLDKVNSEIVSEQKKKEVLLNNKKEMEKYKDIQEREKAEEEKRKQEEEERKKQEEKSKDKGINNLPNESDYFENVLSINTNNTKNLPFYTYINYGENMGAIAATCFKNITIYDITTGKPLTVLNQNNTILSLKRISINFLDYLVSGDVKGKINIWDAKGKKVFKSFGNPNQEKIFAMTTYYNGEKLMLASGGKATIVDIWDFNSGKLVKSLYGHETPIKALISFSINDQPYIASGCDKGELIVWNAITYKPVQKIPAHLTRITSLVHKQIDNIDYIFSGSQDKYIKSWNIKTGELFKSTKIEGIIHGQTTFNINDRDVLLATTKNSIKMYDLKSLEFMSLIGNSTNSFYDVQSIMINNGRVVISSNGNMIRVWKRKNE